MNPTTMKRGHIALAFAVLLLVPAHAIDAQAPSRIVLLDNFGTYERGESLFLFGSISTVVPGSFLVLQMINPNGDICRIQQLTPLSSGMFLTEPIPLNGRICGIAGEYNVQVFYGEHKASAGLTLVPALYQEPSDGEYEGIAEELVRQKITSLSEGAFLDTAPYTERLSAATGVAEMGEIYVDLWVDADAPDEIYELDPTLRPAIVSVLDSIEGLVAGEKISEGDARMMARNVFLAAFYYEIGDKSTAIEGLNDVFVGVRNADPAKTEVKRSLTYAELEEAILNIMVKTGSSLSEEVKEELAFIFARGTVPLYADEIDDLLEMLTKARYLDIVSRKDNPLYNLIQSNWESISTSMAEERSIEDLLERKDRIDKLHNAALLLRDLEDVDRFIGSESEDNSELANIITPDWNSLERDLRLATSADDILDHELEITNMKNVIDISSRITKVVEISDASTVGTDIVAGWEEMLESVRNADSVPEILAIITEFDNSINELREKRSPLSILKFEYQTLKAKAELQGDHANLVTINNALKILDTAQKMEDGHPSVSRIDRIEVLLVWVSETAPVVRADLDSYTKDVYDVRAGDILQRVKSVENLVDLSLRNSRFLPGFTDFTDSMDAKMETIRNLVIEKDLDRADSLSRDLFSEWRTVSKAYADDPHGSDKGYSLDELKRIEFRAHLDEFNDAVGNFYNSDFAPHADEYNRLNSDAHELIDYGNFVDAESKIQEVGNFLQEHLALNHDRVIYDVTYDLEGKIWEVSGYLDKNISTRQTIYLTILDKNADAHSGLEFTDTRDGRFLTKWNAPAEAGLYVALLEWENTKASRLVYVPAEVDYTYTGDDLDMVELARDLEDLKTFMEEFGGANYADKSASLSLILGEIQGAVYERDAEKAGRKLVDLQTAIERYLPERSRVAIIDATYDHNGLVISGAVEKTISFSEDLYVDIFDQTGEKIDEIAITDSPEGYFSESVSTPLNPGIYVVQLSYHDNTTTDFFTVRG